MAQDNAFIGTELKYLLEIEASGFDMDTDYFEVLLKRGSKQLVFHREDLAVETYIEIVDNISVEKHHYYVCFDSEYFGAGLITVVVTAHVPDSDFDDGIRKIVDKFNLVNIQSV